MTVGVRTQRAKPRWLVLLAIVGLLTGLVGTAALANHEGTVSGVFESDDGNLEVDHDPAGDAVDWNSFTNAALAAEWNFERFQDQTGNPDDIFSGGVKQDDDCAGTTTGSLGGGNSKFDLSDIYLSTKVIDDDVFLFLAWVRVPSSPSSSSHIAYEFNQGSDNCTDSDLLERVEDDILIVYDFEGGSADSNVKLARWITDFAERADCEIATKAKTAAAFEGCWGDVIELVESGFADAKVNNPIVTDKDGNETGVGPVFDAHRNETLNPVRFGEAGINLTAAGVFPPQSEADSCLSFGNVMAVSRSSGNSGIAQMKDKVGPHQFDLTNCGRIVVEKVDEDGNRLEGAEFTVTPGQTTNSTTAASSIMDEIEDGLFCLDNLLIGEEYTVSETEVPDGFEGADDQTFEVTQSGTCEGVDGDTDPDLTFVNESAARDITITKYKIDTDVPLAGFTFELFAGHDADPDTDTSLDTGTTDSDGETTFSDVAPGLYTVCETGKPSPSDYWSDGGCQNVTVTTDDENLEFENEPLSKVDITFYNMTGFTTAEIDCGDDGSLTTDKEDDEDTLTLDHLELGVYECTITIANGAVEEEED